jgi:ABC-type nickel/cobalt efflux system permease component RcnA
MSSASWLIVAALIHAVVVTLVSVVVSRISGYKNSQRAAQIAIAALIPVVGAVLVLTMAREAVKEPPQPPDSRFDPQGYNGD